MRKVAVFVDVNNIFDGLERNFDRNKLNYETFLNLAKTYGDVYQAYAYGTQISYKAIDFINCLRQIGFMPKFHKPENRRRINWNAGITVDIINISDRIDTVIIGSADADLIPVIRWVQSKGITVVVIASGISRELRIAANRFVEIQLDMLEGIPDKKGEEEEEGKT